MKASGSFIAPFAPLILSASENSVPTFSRAVFHPSDPLGLGSRRSRAGKEQSAAPFQQGHYASTHRWFRGGDAAATVARGQSFFTKYFGDSV
jgi:hypothetical protein